MTDTGWEVIMPPHERSVQKWSSRNVMPKILSYRPPEAETQSQADDLKQLRVENAKLRMENDTLKKAAAYSDVHRESLCEVRLDQRPCPCVPRALDVPGLTGHA